MVKYDRRMLKAIKTPKPICIHDWQKLYHIIDDVYYFECIKCGKLLKPDKNNLK